MTTNNNTNNAEEIIQILNESILDNNMVKVREYIELAKDKVKVDHVPNFAEHPDIIKLMIENDILSDLLYNKLLVNYATCGNLELVKIVEKKCGDDKVVLHALTCAAGSNHLNVVEYLLRTTIMDSGKYMKLDNNSALIRAASNGYTSVVTYLLNKKADVHANNDLALRESASNGHVKTVKILLDFGADIHADNDIALVGALENNHMKVVQLLLSRGANKDIVKNSRMRITNKKVLALVNGDEYVSKKKSKPVNNSPVVISKDLVELEQLVIQLHKNTIPRIYNEYVVLKDSYDDSVKKLRDIKAIIG